MITENIKINEGFCVHCGVCAEICPEGAISLRPDKYGKLNPIIDYNKCTGCALCYKICPAEPFDFNKAREDCDKDIISLLGNYKDCLLSYSQDENKRYKFSSGGIVKSLLFNALGGKQFCAVVAVVENSSNSLQPHFKIIRNLEDCDSVANSKYCPVSFNGVIKEIIMDTSLNPILFVGLPCHVRAIRRICKYIPSMKMRKIIIIGLFCRKTKDLRYSQYIKNRLVKNNYSENNIQCIQFRGNGWPGKVKFVIQNKKYEEGFNTASIGLFPWKWYLFSPISCLFCYDAFAREADLSIGDPWLKKFVDDKTNKKGINFVVVRTEEGEELLNSCRGLINKNAAVLDVIKSQSIEDIKSKAINAAARMKVLALFSKKFINSSKDVKISISELINAFWFLFFKSLFDFIFQCKFFARMDNFIFKFLTRFPREIICRNK